MINPDLDKDWAIVSDALPGQSGEWSKKVQGAAQRIATVAEVGVYTVDVLSTVNDENSMSGTNLIDARGAINAIKMLIKACDIQPTPCVGDVSKMERETYKTHRKSLDRRSRWEKQMEEDRKISPHLEYMYFGNARRFRLLGISRKDGDPSIEEAVYVDVETQEIYHRPPHEFFDLVIGPMGNMTTNRRFAPIRTSFTVDSANNA